MTTGTINGGIDPQTYALSHGGQADYGTGPVTYSFLNPTQFDGWAPLSGGSYVGMPMQSDVYGGANDVNTQTNQSRYLEGYAPNNLGSYVSPNIGQTAFSLNSAVAQPGRTDMGGNILLNNNGFEVARWGTGIDPSAGQPTVINAGYSYQNGKLVADPNSYGYRTGQNGELVGINSNYTPWANAHPASYGYAPPQSAQGDSGLVTPAVANYGDLSGTPDFQVSDPFAYSASQFGAAPQGATGKINPWEIGMNMQQIAASRAGQPIPQAAPAPAGYDRLYGARIPQQTTYESAGKQAAMARQAPYVPQPQPWVQGQATDFMTQNNTAGQYGMTSALNNYYGLSPTRNLGLSS